MKVSNVYLVFIVFLFSNCKTDPNKQVDEGVFIENKYYSEEIGWTIKIPNGWDITTRDQSQEKQDKGLELIKESNGIDYDVSGLKQLISFQKDRIHSFSATSEKFEIEYEGEYEDNKVLVKELLYNTYASNGIKIDTMSSLARINDVDFDLFKITIYDPQGNILLYQDLYSTYRNGLDFGVNLNYLRKEEKNELLKAWQSSKFD